MLFVFCYTEFAVEIHVAGGKFTYLRIELGDFAAFITAGNVLLESIVGTAPVARAWTSYFATLLTRNPNALRIKTDLTSVGFNLLDPIAVVVLVAVGTIASISTRKTSLHNWIASAINTIVILFVIIAGFLHANSSNLNPFLPYGPEGVFRATAVVYFAYGGFDSIATMAEETKNPSTDIPIGLLGSMSIITVIYCLMALSLSMMQKYTDIDSNAAYSVAFQSAEMKWGKYLVVLGALKGMTSRSTRTSEIRYSHRKDTHDSTYICPRPSQNRNTNKHYPPCDNSKCSHRFLYRFRRFSKPRIDKYSLHLHNDAYCTTCEEILRERNDSKSWSS